MLHRFRPWLLLLLFISVRCICARAQSSSLSGPVTPESLQSFCASQSAEQCVVSFSGRSTLSLRGDWHVPRTLHLQFAAGASLHVQGGSLLFDGGGVDAPPDAEVFPDPDRIHGLAAARPEWFATDPRGDPVPAAALNGAYSATEPWGAIYLQARSYASPFSHCPAGAAFTSFDSTRTLVGAGRPLPDDPAAPHRLQNGTVLLGGIFGHAPLRMVHMGIDVGPTLASRGMGDCQQAGVFIEQPGRDFVSGDRLVDVSVLTTGAFNMHSVMIAGHQNTEVRNLWIWTLGGTHGLVMKSSRSVIDGLHCFGAVSDCLIIKSDYVTDFLGRANDVRASHVEIAPLPGIEPVGGILIDAAWDAVRSIKLSDIHERGTTVGISVRGSHLHGAHDIDISDWSVLDEPLACLAGDRIDGLLVDRFACDLEARATAGVALSRTRNALLENGVIRCADPTAACAAGHTDGLNLSESSADTRQVHIVALGGYAVRSTERLGPSSGIHLADMGDRAYVWAPLSFWERSKTFALQIRPDGRIVYDMIYFRPLLRMGVLVTAFLFAALLVWFLRNEMIRRRVSSAR